MARLSDTNRKCYFCPFVNGQVPLKSQRHVRDHKNSPNKYRFRNHEEVIRLQNLEAGIMSSSRDASSDGSLELGSETPYDVDSISNDNDANPMSMEEDNCYEDDNIPYIAPGVQEDGWVIPGDDERISTSIEEATVQVERPRDASTLSQNQRKRLNAAFGKLMHNFTDKQFNYAAKIFSIPESSQFGSWKSTLNEVVRLSREVEIHEYVACPDGCCAYTDLETLSPQSICFYCSARLFDAKGKQRGVYRYYPLTPRLSNLFRHSKTAKQMAYRHEHLKEPSEYIRDYFDGSYYKDNLAPDDNQYTVRLGLSGDGFQLFKNVTHECYLLTLVNFSLSPKIRYRLENLLPISVTSGPKGPADIDSLLRPLINELNGPLRDGVEIVAYDEYQGQQRYIKRTMKAHLILMFADIPAAAKLSGTKSTGGIQSCRHCHLHGLEFIAAGKPSRYYFPHSAPAAPVHHHKIGKVQSALREYEAKCDLRRKTIDDYVPSWNRLYHMQVHDFPKADILEYQTATGITREPLLAHVPTLKYPDGIAYEAMHNSVSNVTKNMIRHWLAKFFKDDNMNKETYNLKKAKAKLFGSTYAKNSNNIPGAFGRKLRDLATNSSLQAEEYLDFLMLYSMPLVNAFLPAHVVDHWALFVRAHQLLLSVDGVGPSELDEVEQLMHKFVKDYEIIYLKNDYNRLKACSITFHYLLHVADNVRAYGPMQHYWAFSTERLIGRLGTLVTSRSRPAANLNNRLDQLIRLQEINKSFLDSHFDWRNFESLLAKDTESSTDVDDGNDEDTDGLGISNDQYYDTPASQVTLKYAQPGRTLDKNDRIALCNFYSVAYIGHRIIDFPYAEAHCSPNFEPYGRMEMDGEMYGSVEYPHTSDLNRRNAYTIRVDLLVDENANRTDDVVVMVEGPRRYGIVQYYAKHYFEGRWHQVACIRLYKTSEVEVDRFATAFIVGELNKALEDEVVFVGAGDIGALLCPFYTPAVEYKRRDSRTGRKRKYTYPERTSFVDRLHIISLPPH